MPRSLTGWRGLVASCLIAFFCSPVASLSAHAAGNSPIDRGSHDTIARVAERAVDAVAESAAIRLALRCANDETQVDFDPVCHRTLAPGDARRGLQRAQRDRGLLLAYPDLHALYRMRDSQLDDIDTQIGLARRRMVSLHRELEGFRQMAEQTQAPPSAAVPRTEAAMTQARRRASAILAEDELIRTHRLEQERIRSRFDRDARRLRHLLSANTPGTATLARR